MLRTGLARALPPRSVPSLPLSQRTLVSTVLLSRDAAKYEASKLNDLKAEARLRGLSTAGKRKDLIGRLLEDDKRKVAADSPRPASATNNFSTSTKNDAQVEDLVKSQDKITSAGVTKQTDRDVASTVAPNVGSPQLKQPSAGGPPGIPPHKLRQVPPTYLAEIPDFPPETEEGAPIPVVPDNYAFHSPAAPQPSGEGPKVVTVASPLTHPGGGPSHNISRTSDPHVFENPDLAQDPHHSQGDFLSDLLSNFGIGGVSTQKAAEQGREVAEKGKTASVGAWQQIRSAALDAAGLSPASSGSGAGSGPSYQNSSSGGSVASANRPLTDEERAGLYFLAGLFGAGYVLGAFGEKKSEKSGGHRSSSGSGIREETHFKTGKGIVGSGPRKA